MSEQWAVLPEYLGNHLWISLVALSMGIAISLPLGVFIVPRPWVRRGVMGVVSVTQTIPGLALLALMVPLLGFGFWPAVCALTLYSVLPILRNTVTGIADVDPAMTEAAKALGMRPGQVLVRVELPLAAPVILAGLRTATVWTVGMATLATPVGQSCLGNYIFGGLQTRNWHEVLFGCVAAAALAITLDGLIGLLEHAVRSRSRRLSIAALCGLLLVFGGGLAPRVAAALAPPPVAPDGGEQLQVIVGAKGFSEQYILGALIGDLVDASGAMKSKPMGSLGSNMIFSALTKGEVDVYVDYTGTIWTTEMKRKAPVSAPEMLAEVTTYLRETHGVTCLGPLGFENAYALAMRRKQAQELGISSITDLAKHAKGLRLGSDYEFLKRPEWKRVRDLYGLAFKEKPTFDPAFMYEACAKGSADVICGFSSDGRIAAFDLVVLDDPLQAFPPYDAILLLSSKAGKDARLVDALRPLIHAIDLDLMQRANQQVDIKKETPKAAARWLRDALPKAGRDSALRALQRAYYLAPAEDRPRIKALIEELRARDE